MILNGNGLPYDPVYGNKLGTITGATNASPIVITSNNHGLVNGDRVTITGVTGNTAANGTFTILVLDIDTFSLTGTTGNGAYGGGGDWTYTSSAGRICHEYYPEGNLLLLGIPLAID